MPPRDNDGARGSGGRGRFSPPIPGADPNKPGSFAYDIILAVGGVTEKIRSIMDPFLGMSGACLPWQNKHDIQPLLINCRSEYLLQEDIPGIRIYRQGDEAPFDVYFCKTKWHVYQIMMHIDRDQVERRMADRCRRDSDVVRRSDRSWRQRETTVTQG